MTKLTQSKNFSPLLILLTIIGFIGFLAWSAFQAGELGSEVTDAAYYSKGLKYNTTQVEKRAAEVLGWKLETDMRERVLQMRLTDNRGEPVTGAMGTIYLAVPGAAENILLPLEEMGRGRYRVQLADSVKGAVQARLEIERHGARLNRQLLLNL